MPPQILSLKMVNKVDDLETHLDDLLRQKDILQRIEQYTNDKLDFGDIIETYNLLVEEIERLQKQLREEKEKCLRISGEKGLKEEGVSPPSSSTSNTKDYLLKYVDHKYIIRALNKVLEEKEPEVKVCGICNMIKPVKEFSTDLICKCCDESIGFAVKRSAELLG